MKSVFIILGNGFTIDFINKYNDFLENKKEKRVRIDVQNLFRYGEVIGTPWDDKPGFLSYKVCPALWTLVARPDNNAAENNALIEEIISCANMFSFFSAASVAALSASLLLSSQSKTHQISSPSLGRYSDWPISWRACLTRCSAALCLDVIGVTSTRQFRERKCLKYLISVSSPSQIM